MLAQIMQTSLKTIPEGSSIVAAAEKMRKERVGALLVQRKDTYVGIITDTDIVHKVVGAKKSLETPVEQFMNLSIPSIQVTRTSHEAFDLMGDLGVRHLVIRDGEKTVGLVSMRDLLFYFRSLEPNIGVD